MEKHFGIDHLTSYAWVSYKDLKDQVEDKQLKSGEYKALQKERQMLRAALKRLLFPTAHYPPTLRKIVGDLFEQIHAHGLRMPDGSERLITFRLGEKAGIELANTTSIFVSIGGPISIKMTPQDGWNIVWDFGLAYKMKNGKEYITLSDVQKELISNKVNKYKDRIFIDGEIIYLLFIEQPYSSAERAQ